jgi:hypothetical protein
MFGRAVKVIDGTKVTMIEPCKPLAPKTRLVCQAHDARASNLGRARAVAFSAVNLSDDTSRFSAPEDKDKVLTVHVHPVPYLSALRSL